MNDSQQRGFTLIEVLVSVTIFAMVMSILYSSFSTSSANAEIVEKMADDLSSLNGALDTFSHEVRGVYSISESSVEKFSGDKEAVSFTTTNPFVRDGEPTIQIVSYIFEEDKIIRKVFKPGPHKEVKGEYLLLDGIEDPAFSFFDGNGWIGEWTSTKKIPEGIKISFLYKGQSVENIIPVWSRM